MVEDRVTDGERTAQLLASELSGRSGGALDRLAVVDPDRDAEPTPEGTVAYGIAVDDERVGDVRIYPDGAEIGFEPHGEALDAEKVAESVSGPGLSADSEGHGAVVVRIEYGAAVKRAVDALVSGLDS